MHLLPPADSLPRTLTFWSEIMEPNLWDLISPNPLCPDSFEREGDKRFSIDESQGSPNIFSFHLAKSDRFHCIWIVACSIHTIEDACISPTNAPLATAQKHCKNPKVSSIRAMVAIQSNENSFMQTLCHRLRIWSIPLRDYTRSISWFSQTVAESRNLGASHLFERTNEELAMNGGGASYAQHSPSGLSSHMTHLDVHYQKSSDCASRTVSNRTVLIFLQRSNPNQCRANGVWRACEKSKFSDRILHTTAEALYMRSFTCVESADFVLPHNPAERRSRHLCNYSAQVSFRSASSKYHPHLPSRLACLQDLPTATTMKIIIRKRLNKKGVQGGLYMYITYKCTVSSVRTVRKNDLFTLRHCLGQQFSTVMMLGLHIYRDLPIPIKRSQTTNNKQPDGYIPTLTYFHHPTAFCHHRSSLNLSKTVSRFQFPSSYCSDVCTSMALCRPSAVIHPDPVDKNNDTNPHEPACYLYLLGR